MCVCVCVCVCMECVCVCVCEGSRVRSVAGIMGKMSKALKE